jgi:hypothetical protein
MFNSESNVRLNEWFHQNKYPHQKLQVGCQLLGWQVIEIKGHIRGSSEPYLPDDGLCPHPGRKTRLLTIQMAVPDAAKQSSRRNTLESQRKHQMFSCNIQYG